MIKIGLTGGIGSGKSTVSNFLTKIGIKVVDADIISREVLELYPEILLDIKAAFGTDVFQEDGTLDRRKLGGIIFKETSKKGILENIIIPRILTEIAKRVDLMEKSGETLVVIDAPTLMEHNIHKEMDYNIVIWVDLDTQIKRVMKRDGLTKDETLERINSQMPLDQKKMQGDYIIDNRFFVDDTLEQMKKILGEINEMEKTKIENI